MIDQLSLKNWKTHFDSTLSFSNGTNVIIGNVGTGKSSVLDAVCFALFGTFPNLQSKKIKLDDVIMARPVQKDKAEVQISFSVEEKKCVIKRVVERGKGTTYSDIRIDGKLVDTNASRVSEMAAKILKTNYETFSKAIYSEQNNLDYFLSLGKGQRIRKIDELLMIDKFESARSNCVSVYNKLSDRKSSMQIMVEQMRIEDVEARMKELEDVIAGLKNEIDSMTRNLDSITKERSDLEKEVRSMSSLSSDIESLQREKNLMESLLIGISDTMASLKKEVAGQNAIDADYMKKIKDDISGLETYVKDYRFKREKLLTGLADLRSKESMLSEDVEEVEDDVKSKLAAKEELEFYKKTIGMDVEKEIGEKKSLLKKMIFDTESARGRIRDLQISVEQLQQSGSKCPVCEKRLDEESKKLLVKGKKKDIEALSEYLSKAEKERESTEAQIGKLESSLKEIKELEIKMGNIAKIEGQLKEKKASLKKIKNESESHAKLLKEVERDLAEKSERLEKKRSEKESAEYLFLKFRELHEQEKKKSEISGKLETVSKKLTEKEYKLEGRDLENLKSKLNSATVREVEYRTQMSSKREILKEKALRLSELTIELDKWKVIKVKIKKLENTVLDLKIFEKALEATQAELRTQFVEAVNYTINQLWNTLYPYGDFMEIKLHVEEGDYVLKLLSKSGTWSNVDGMVSGGERSIACLALRIAFALTLAPHLRILILDEPSQNLDARTLSELATTLRERVYEFMDQVILITHEDELQEATTGKAYRLDRDKTNDGATSVVQIQ